MTDSKQRQSASRREFIKKAAYIAPAILTLQAAPSYAKKGSEKPEKPEKPDKPDKPDKLDDGQGKG